MIPFLMMLFYSPSLFETMMFRNSGWNSIIYDHDPYWRWSGKSVQIENKWVWSSQDRFRIARHGNSIKDIDAQLSKVEDGGKEKKNQKLRLRNFDARNERIETGPVVKKRKRLSGGTVFERRPMQFPARRWRACKTDTENRSTLWATNTKR